uniref:Protein argonaute 2-like n=1 Tax=Nelumbo nucifera TaxID=4432 RepID=A0A822ZKE1_NELNU|nr:TPA_asm: hypothetical protein HUJ06_002059 [Nelumbo nucifera]
MRKLDVVYWSLSLKAEAARQGTSSCLQSSLATKYCACLFVHSAMENFPKGRGRGRGRSGDGGRRGGRGRRSHHQGYQHGQESRAGNPNPNYPTQQSSYQPISGHEGSFRQVPTSGRGQSGGPTRSTPGSGPACVPSGEGSSRGSGPAWGGKRAEKVPIQSPISDPQVAELTSLDISLALTPSPASRVGERVPVKRPDNGGKWATQFSQLLVNHFPIKYNPNLIIFHYDVDIKPEVTPKQGRSLRITKSLMHMIRNKLFSDLPKNFPMAKTAYDGEKSIFSAVKLPAGEFEVEMSMEEGQGSCAFMFTINLVKELPLQKLENYLRGTLSSIPREILQGMDLVMKENPTRHRIQIGRSFSSNNSDNIGLLIASREFQHSLKLTSQGLALCSDYSVLALLKKVPVLQFLRDHIPNFKLNYGPVPHWVTKKIEKALKGLKVTVIHRTTKRKYIIRGLTSSVTNNLSFPIEDPMVSIQREVGLVEYFKDKYNKVIEHRYLPCLDLSKGGKMNYVPMEFCVLVEGQRYPKDRLDMLAGDVQSNFNRFALAKPSVRKDCICTMVKADDGPCGGGIAQNFEIAVSEHMTEVTGHVIQPPSLKLGNVNGEASRVTVSGDCQWNLIGKCVLEGKRVERWAIIDFADRNVKLNYIQFARKLVIRCRKLHIEMKEPLFYEPSEMCELRNSKQLSKHLSSICSRAKEISGGQLQILICAMSEKDAGYNNLKRICETEIGIMTQCCLSKNANKDKGLDQYLANLALKINAKLGGSNVELFEKLLRLEGNGHVMFIGADVNHPAAFNTSSPSIAAVVATMNWPAANKYAARIRLQDHRVESIKHFGQMCLELLEAYARINKVKPEKIIVFRDGVSESQFDMVLNDELTDLKSAIESDGYSPTITLVVAQKRHQTRLFPKDRNQGGPTGNVHPGTVVDTTIVHPWEFDFYLCSHYGSLGTSKPTHYHVLWDEHRFTSDDLQSVIYNLCFTFARCTKPVSLVPPVYYADLVAYRGRQYYEALQYSASSASPSSLSTSSSFDQSVSLKLHNDLENVMFFC